MQCAQFHDGGVIEAWLGPVNELGCQVPVLFPPGGGIYRRAVVEQTGKHTGNIGIHQWCRAVESKTQYGANGVIPDAGQAADALLICGEFPAKAGFWMNWKVASNLKSPSKIRIISGGSKNFPIFG